MCLPQAGPMETGNKATDLEPGHCVDLKELQQH